MAKELYLYETIGDWSAERLVMQLDEYKSQDINLRISCDGGNPESGWSVIAKFSEHDKAKSVSVDGKAYSMATFFLCYVDESDCLDVTEFLIHRAAYSSYYESDPEYFTPEVRGNLERINKNLRKALEAKIDVAKFEEITGTTLDEVFSMDQRKDVYLSAEQAKEIGLVNKIVKITPERKAQIATQKIQIAARGGVDVTKEIEYLFKTAAMAENKKDEESKKEESKVVTDPVGDSDYDKGIKAERERVAAWSVWSDVDPEAVKAGIESGKPISAKEQNEFMKKNSSASKLKSIENGNGEQVSTTEPEVSAEGKTYLDNGKEVKLSAEQVNSGKAEIQAAIERAKKHVNPNYKSE